MRGSPRRPDRWGRDEWFIAVRERSADGRITGPPRVPNPPGRYLCDPFAIEADGRHLVFVRTISATGRGAISVFELGPGGAASPPQRVLERDHHLSYPFVFSHDGAVHMIPETGEAGRIELHTAVELPARWRLERVLIDGLIAHDATLHVEDGTLWLFASVVEGPADPGVLHLFSAPSLDAAWTPHPANPIVTDPGLPPGRPPLQPWRRPDPPGQDGSRRYGGAVVLHRVDCSRPKTTGRRRSGGSTPTGCRVSSARTHTRSTPATSFSTGIAMSAASASDADDGSTIAGRRPGDRLSPSLGRSPGVRRARLRATEADDDGETAKRFRLR